ncbi:MAG TPA: glycosyltransferase family 4 protein [Solirubrobacterales bacterium]|nr:glycosyltransferase family 4 protein [Solirubrobacterales bacterium]
MSSARLLVVCPVLPFPPIDGGRKRTLRLLEAADAAGYVPYILTTDGEDPELVAALRERGWTVEVLAPPPATIPHRLHQHLRRLPSPFIPSVEARLRELAHQPDTLVQIEHTQSAYYDRALTGVPWVLSLHNVDSELLRTIARTKRPGTAAWLRGWSQWQAMRSVERREVRRATATLVVSESDRTGLEAPGADLIVSPNGIDDDFFEIPLEGAEPDRVLFFGRHDYPPNEHGLARFLREGWPRVTAARPSARLRIAGSGATDEVRELAAATPGVEFLGFVDDLTGEIAASALTIVPLWAGGGTRLKVVEGMASSRPIVGTALGVEGVGFESGRHGLVAESPRGLADAVDALLGDPARARELGITAREHAEQYRWRHTTAPAVELYRRLLPLDANPLRKPASTAF